MISRIEIDNTNYDIRNFLTSSWILEGDEKTLNGNYYFNRKGIRYRGTMSFVFLTKNEVEKLEPIFNEHNTFKFYPTRDIKESLICRLSRESILALRQAYMQNGHKINSITVEAVERRDNIGFNLAHLIDEEKDYILNDEGGRTIVT